MSNFPPKPKLTFRVGVVGHRPNRLVAEKIAELKETIRHLLQLIATQVAEDARRHADVYEGGAAASPTLRIISPLAEGTDRLAAEIALDLGFELQCPMPFSQAEFEKDFNPPNALTPNSLGEFHGLLDRAEKTGRLVKFSLDGSRTDASAAYGAAGRVVLNQSDVLLAVWDGKEAAGGGGTVQTLRDAITYRVPVLWIDALNPAQWQILSSFADLRFHDAEHRCVPHCDKLGAEEERLKQEVSPALEPPQGAGSGSFSHSGTGRDHATLHDFLHETHPVRNLAIAWKLFRDFVWHGKLVIPPIRVAPFEDAVADSWPTDKLGFGVWINRQLRPYYAWADKLGDYYADAYRSAFVVAYVLGGLAVLFAILGPATEAYHYETLFVGTELVLILVILLSVFWGRHKHWHGRWVSYRLVAELIRQLRFLAPLGGARPFPRIATLPQHSAYGDPTQTWMYWYVRGVERQVGLPPAQIDRAYLDQYMSFLGDSIDGQIAFHVNNESRSKAIENRLRLVGYWLFGLTAAACCLHLLSLQREWSLCGATTSVLILIAGVFPAFGAALAAIRDQGEFQRLEMRSAAMATRLNQNRLTLERFRERNQQGTTPTVSSADVVELAEDVVKLMVSEVLEWRIVFLDRPLETRA